MGVGQNFRASNVSVVAKHLQNDWQSVQGLYRDRGAGISEKTLALGQNQGKRGRKFVQPELELIAEVFVLTIPIWVEVSVTFRA